MTHTDRMRSFVRAGFSYIARNGGDLVIECLPFPNNDSERDTPI